MKQIDTETTTTWSSWWFPSIAFVSRWAIGKELELGTQKIGQVSGVKITRHFALVTRTGPAPHGPAGALRDFALGRTRLLSNTPRKSG